MWLNKNFNRHRHGFSLTSSESNIHRIITIMKNTYISQYTHLKFDEYAFLIFTYIHTDCCRLLFVTIEYLMMVYIVIFGVRTFRSCTIDNNVELNIINYVWPNFVLCVVLWIGMYYWWVNIQLCVWHIYLLALEFWLLYIVGLKKN